MPMSEVRVPLTMERWDALHRRVAALEADCDERERAAVMEGERRIAALEAERDRLRVELEAEKTRGIDHAVYEMVCEERDALEAERDRLREALAKARTHFAAMLREQEAAFAALAELDAAGPQEDFGTSGGGKNERTELGRKPR